MSSVKESVNKFNTIISDLSAKVEKVVAPAKVAAPKVDAAKVEEKVVKVAPVKTVAKVEKTAAPKVDAVKTAPAKVSAPVKTEKVEKTAAPVKKVEKTEKVAPAKVAAPKVDAVKTEKVEKTAAPVKKTEEKVVKVDAVKKTSAPVKKTVVKVEKTEEKVVKVDAPKVDVVDAAKVEKTETTTDPSFPRKRKSEIDRQESPKRRKLEETCLIEEFCTGDVCTGDVCTGDVCRVDSVDELISEFIDIGENPVKVEEKVEKKDVEKDVDETENPENPVKVVEVENPVKVEEKDVDETENPVKVEEKDVEDETETPVKVEEKILDEILDVEDSSSIPSSTPSSSIPSSTPSTSSTSSTSIPTQETLLKLLETTLSKKTIVKLQKKDLEEVLKSTNVSEGFKKIMNKIPPREKQTLAKKIQNLARVRPQNGEGTLILQTRKVKIVKSKPENLHIMKYSDSNTYFIGNPGGKKNKLASKFFGMDLFGDVYVSGIVNVH